MNQAALAWLAARTPPAPAPLRERMAAALRESDPELGVPTALAEAALVRLRRALALGDERAAAYELLTADALLSHAFEAAAEQGVETVEAVAESYGAARLASLITAEE